MRYAHVLDELVNGAVTKTYAYGLQRISENQLGGSTLIALSTNLADGTCRSAAELMAAEGIVSLAVVDRTTQRINGTITPQDLVKRTRQGGPARE